MIRILIILLIAFGFCGCSSTKYVPVESVSTDSLSVNIETQFHQLRSMLESLRHEVNTRDSVSTKESKLIIINQQGDTVYREIERERDTSHYRDEMVQSLKIYYDSVMRSQNERIEALIRQLDSIPVPVEKKLTFWEKAKQEAGGVAIGCMFPLLCYVIIWLVRRLKAHK